MTPVRTALNIESEVRIHLPLVFDGTDAAVRSEFLLKKNRMIAYMRTVSVPFLTPETLRYQTLVLYSSLVFLAMKLFAFDKLKVADTEIRVDHSLLVFFTIFIVIISILFVTKAWVDAQRMKVLREEGAEVMPETLNMLNTLRLKEHIQQYFWQELADAIGGTYVTYSKAREAVRDKVSDFKYSAMNPWTLDRKALAESRELDDEIKRQEAFFKAMKTDLANDEQAFQVKADSILAAAKSHDDKDSWKYFDGYHGISKAFDEHLRHWHDARAELISQNSFRLAREGLNDPIVQSLSTVNRLLLGELRRRSVYAMVEVSVPLVWMVAVLWYGWFRM